MNVIKVENLSKKYTIRHQQRERYTALRDVLTHGAKRLGAKLLSPFIARPSSHEPRASSFEPSATSSKEEFWALKDVSFEVKQGEVIGIIGRNGAGKSTLLKILSRITEPTTGRVKIKGRVASLLEVGTGFHPELTGRENIYLNGAILGMTKAEIKRKFDEIVAFAEIEKFLDTPVKRYSSGMYVRLAFAVAAHLEPEILVVDEVLAVGDAQFQKKCMGKMGEVARGGRTVLFVSHNMGAIRSLCMRVIYIEEGKVLLDGASSQSISTYLSSRMSRSSESQGEIFFSQDNSSPSGTEEIFLHGLRTTGPEGIPQSTFEADKLIKVEIYYEIKRPIRGLRFNLYVLTQEGEIAFLTTDHDFRKEIEFPGMYKNECIIPEGLLNRRGYIIAISCDIPGVKVLIPRKECLNILVSGVGNQSSTFSEVWPGVVCPHLNWHIGKIDSGEFKQGG